MPKITFVGAGSTVFAKQLLTDILLYPELAESEIVLFDINQERLNTSEVMAHQLAGITGTTPMIKAVTDRKQALDGADYVFTMFQVGGYEPATVTDFEIPRRYGLRQTIGDTLGIGGIMRALRTIPVLLVICRDMEAMCPNALLLQYVNPMAMLQWAVNRATTIKSVGLCHSVPHTASTLANDIGIPLDEINYLVAGINHVAFFLKFERNGENLYRYLFKLIEEGRVPGHDRVRYEMLKRLGYFVTESSEHFSEYTPYFINQNRADLIKRFNIPLDEYMHRCELQIKAWNIFRHKIEEPEFDEQGVLEDILHDAKVTPGMISFMTNTFSDLDKARKSGEYGIQIIHSIETGMPRVIYGNVANTGLIDNLPNGCTVEVPCLVDKAGVQPTRIGTLPPQLSALMQTNINVQALTVEGALTQKREHIYHAAMLDPHTAAELDLDQIWNLVDDLLEAHQEWLPEYY